MKTYHDRQKEEAQHEADEAHTRDIGKRARLEECGNEARLKDISKAIQALIIKPLILEDKNDPLGS